MRSHAYNLAHFPGFGCPILFSPTPNTFIHQQPAHCCLDTHQGEAHMILPVRKKYLKKFLIFCNLLYYSLKSYNLASEHIKLLKLLTTPSNKISVLTANTDKMSITLHTCWAFLSALYMY